MGLRERCPRPRRAQQPAHCRHPHLGPLKKNWQGNHIKTGPGLGRFKRGELQLSIATSCYDPPGPEHARYTHPTPVLPRLPDSAYVHVHCADDAT